MWVLPFFRVLPTLSFSVYFPSDALHAAELCSVHGIGQRFWNQPVLIWTSIWVSLCTAAPLCTEVMSSTSATAFYKTLPGSPQLLDGTRVPSPSPTKPTSGPRPHIPEVALQLSPLCPHSTQPTFPFPQLQHAEAAPTPAFPLPRALPAFTAQHWIPPALQAHFQIPLEPLCRQLGFQVLQCLDAKDAIHTHEMETVPSALHLLGEKPGSPH